MSATMYFEIDSVNITATGLISRLKKLIFLSCHIQLIIIFSIEK